MPKATKAFTNFTAGEITPRLFARTDISKYDNGAETVENYIVQPHGGLSRRPGTRFVAEVKSSSAAVRLIPFEFNVTQTYVLEFGDDYFRVLKEGGQVESGGSVVEVATPYGTADLDSLKFAQSADVMYVVSPSYTIRKITRTSHTAWTITEVDLARGPMLDINSSTTTITSNGHSGSVTLTASADLFAATDVGRLVKVQHGFVKITGYTNATTVAGTVQALSDGRAEIMPSYTAATISFHEGDPDATGLEHNDRIEDSAGDFIAQGFVAGQTVTVSGTTNNNDTTGRLIVDVTDTVLTLAPGADLTTEAASSNNVVQGKLAADLTWQLGAFSGTTGYPRSVAFYEQRLVFGGTSNQPQTLFFSQSGDFENFESGSADDAGMVYTIGSNEVNVIRYLSSTRSLIAGTSGGEFIVRSGGADNPITPTSIQIKQQTNYGSADTSPAQVGNTILFLQRAKRKLRELQFNFDVDGYVAPDLTLISEHITEGGLVELAYQQEPDGVIWGVRADGQLACMTYKPEEKIIGWTRQKIGGVFGTGDAVVERVCALPGDLDEDELYLVVKRTINGATKRYIEFIKDWEFGTSVSDAIFVDSSLTYTGTTSTLGAGINNSVTTVALADASGFSSSGAIKVNNEIITYTGKSSNDLTGCTRGVDSVAAAHDSGATATQAAITLSGLSHLEGQTVDVLGDGAVHPSKTVSSAAITLDRYVTKAHVGLPYTSTLKTLRVDAGSAIGTAQGKLKRISEVTVRLYRSVGLSIGDNELDILPFRSSADEMNEPLPLYTGDKEIEFRGGFDSDGQIIVQQTQPLPQTILGVYATLTTFDQ